MAEGREVRLRSLGSRQVFSRSGGRWERREALGLHREEANKCLAPKGTNAEHEIRQLRKGGEELRSKGEKGCRRQGAAGGERQKREQQDGKGEGPTAST